MPLLNQWEAQDRKLRLGQEQQTWETVEGTSGPLEEKGELYNGYCWPGSSAYRGKPKKIYKLFYT